MSHVQDILNSMKYFQLLIFILSIHTNAGQALKIIYLTDLEGNGKKWDEFITHSDAFYFDEHKLRLKDDYILVYGGDATDFGDSSMYILNDLLSLKEDCPDRVHLLIGNRDLNKLFLPFALREMKSSNISLAESVEHFLSSLNAGKAFSLRQQELDKRSSHSVTALDVAQSFIKDVEPGGLMFRYIQAAELGVIIQNTVFVHGAVNDENFLKMPSGKKAKSVQEWIQKLNLWKDEEFKNWAKNPESSLNLIRYSKDLDGLIRARYSDKTGNSQIPSDEVIAKLQSDGIDRIVVGHTPNGQSPTILRENSNFEIVIADNSECIDCGANIIRISEDGQILHLKTATTEAGVIENELILGKESLVGKKIGEWLIKGVLPDETYILSRVEQPNFHNRILKTKSLDPTVLKNIKNLCVSSLY